MKYNATVLVALISVVCTWWDGPLSTVQAVPTTGWIWAGGSYDYNSPSNWVDGAVNGIWDTSLVVTSSATTTFATNTLLGTGLTFKFDGNFDVILRGTGGNRLLMLGGDILVNPVLNRSVTIGYVSTGAYLDVDLGGVNRTFTARTGKTLLFYNSTISNGSFAITGGGTVTLKGPFAAAPASDVTADSAMILKFDSNSSSGIGTNRARNATLRTATLSVVGNTVTTSVDTLTGVLLFDTATPGGDNIVTFSYGSGSGKNEQLSVGNLIRTNNAITLFRGVSLGSAPADNVANVFSGVAPTAQLVGGGGVAGTKNISILPWGIGGNTATDNGSSFVTYDAANGIRVLDSVTECDSTITDGSISDHNVCLPPGTALTLNSTSTVNSLILNASPSSSNVTVSGTNPLRILSGGVFGQVGSSQATISKPLDFGNREGVIGVVAGKYMTVGAISGSGGLTLHSPGTPSGANTGVRLNSACTYTGDTTIIGTATLQTSDILPSGIRSGNICVHGVLWLNNQSPTLNGLAGDGTVAQGNTGNITLTVGDNNATSLFMGTIKETSTGRLAVTKIGGGTLTLGGTNTYTGPTAISNGTLVLNGSLASTVTVCSNAVLAGEGLIATNTTALTVNNDGLVAPGAVGGGIGTLTVTGDVYFAAGGRLQLDASGTNTDLLAVTGTVGAATGPIHVSVTASGAGPWKVMTAGSITAEFSCDTTGLRLARSMDNTELWLSRAKSGTLILVR